MTPATHKPKVRVGQVAARHGVARQTMASYIKAGAPAHDPEAMDEWIREHRLQVEVARLIRGGRP